MLHFRHETYGFSLLNNVSANKNTFPFSTVFFKMRSYKKMLEGKQVIKIMKKSVLEKI